MKLLENLTKRGYPKRIVCQAITKAATLKREDLLVTKDTATTTQKTTVPLVLTFRPQTKHISSIMYRYLKILQNTPDVNSQEKFRIICAFRHARNIRQMLVTTNLITTNGQKGSNPCNKPCTTCKYMRGTEKIISHATKITYKIHGKHNCTSKNVIYLIECAKCRIQYIGQSGNTMRERLSGHLNDIKANNLVKPVSKHFLRLGHTNEDMQVTIVTTTSNNINTRLRTEETWIAELRTRTPLGLNLIS